MKSPTSVPSIDATEAEQRLAAGTAGPLLVDVREPDEFETVRIPGAVLMPLSSFGETFEALPRDRPLLLMCAAGRRSAAAAEHLARNGFSDVTNLDGGITAWQRAGLPTRMGPRAPGEGDLLAD